MNMMGVLMTRSTSSRCSTSPYSFLCKFTEFFLRGGEITERNGNIGVNCLVFLVVCILYYFVFICANESAWA
jgi:hypothetical protein